MFQDFQFAMRTLAKSRVFSLVAILSLALGIGANTAIFSVISTVLLRPLPFHEPDRLAMIWEDSSAIGFPQDTPAPGNFADWKKQSQTFEDMAALGPRSLNLTGDGEPEKLSGYSVTANIFPLLGVKPAIGRTFSAEEDQPGGARVVIISHSLWQTRYGSDPSILNRNILLNDEKYTVIGVMPSDFQFGASYVRFWIPMAFTSEELANHGNHYLEVIGRLKPGVTLAQANSDIKSIMKRIAAEHPDDAAQTGALVIPLHEQFTGGMKRSLWMLLGAVACVLLIACANIAGLLLSRAAARQREIAVRCALGAGRWRIVRQLLVESTLLAGIGGVLGVVLAIWSFAFLRQLVPEEMANSATLQMDAGVFAFAFAVSVLSGLFFGLAPALQASRLRLTSALNEGGNRSGFGSAHQRLRSVLVVGEVALALVLLVCAGLLIQTLSKLHSQYSNLHGESLLTLRTSLPENRYREHSKRVAFYDQVLQKVEAIPGVISAGYSTSVPLEWAGGANGITIEGRQAETGASFNANHRQVSASYLQTMGIGLEKGRYFSAHDDAQSQPVAIINRTMARQYWPGEDPIGKRFRNGSPESDRPWLTIVGVVADVRQMGVDQPTKAEMYFPYKQIRTHAFFTPRDLVVRASVIPSNLVPSVRAAVYSVDPNQPISNIRTMDNVLSEQTRMRSLAMSLLTAFAGLALLLSMLGIYGVLSYFVAQHTREIGVRLALGADGRKIFSFVLTRGFVLALIGIAIGLGVSLVITRLLRSLLFEVSAVDPLTYLAVTVVLLVVAITACALPAIRAARVDPLVALRYE